MACFHPVSAFRTVTGEVVFSELKRHDIVQSFDLPCGRCRGCRLEHSRQWAVRMVHEQQLHQVSCFVTLTYSDDNLPEDGSLRYSDVQRFLKKLRSLVRRDAIKRKLKVLPTVRFFCAGEYGEELSRPHYHLALFGFRPMDGKFWQRGEAGFPLYRSAVLESLWPHGFSNFGELTFESAGYIARYCFKKVGGDLAKSHYEFVDAATGEVTQRVREFAHMSLKPGIGAEWFNKFRSDVSPDGKVVFRGSEFRAPKYYDKLLKRVDADAAEDVAFRREAEARLHSADNTNERLAVREQVTLARSSLLKRSMS